MDSSNSLRHAILSWMQTLEVWKDSSTELDPSSSLSLASVLNYIAPEFFDAAFLEKLHRNQLNRRIRQQNARKLIQALTEYFADTLQMQIPDHLVPDVQRYVQESEDQNADENQSVSESTKLLQLVLGIAVKCKSQQQFVSSMMQLDPQVQAALMAGIQQLMTSTSAEEEVTVIEQENVDLDQSNALPLPLPDRDLACGNVNDQDEGRVNLIASVVHQHSRSDSYFISESRENHQLVEDKLRRALDELQNDNSRLGARLGSTTRENGTSRPMITQGDDSNEPNSVPSDAEASPKSGRTSSLQSVMDVDRLREENAELSWRLSNLREELAASSEQLAQLDAANAELRRELTSRNAQLETMRAERETFRADALRLRDALDELGETRANCETLASQLDAARRKAEEANEARRAQRAAETRASDMAARCERLEGELERATLTRGAFDAQRSELANAAAALETERRRALALEADCARLNERVEALVREQRRTIDDRDALREQLDELSAVHQNASHSQVEELLGSNCAADAELLSVPLSVRERLSALEKENGALKAAEASRPAVQAMLEEARVRNANLEQENRHLRSSKANGNVPMDTGSLPEQNNATRSERELIGSLEEAIQHEHQQLVDKRNECDQLNEALRQAEERYKVYFSRAKLVINALNSRNRQLESIALAAAAAASQAAPSTSKAADGEPPTAGCENVQEAAKSRPVIAQEGGDRLTELLRSQLREASAEIVMLRRRVIDLETSNREIGTRKSLIPVPIRRESFLNRQRQAGTSDSGPDTARDARNGSTAANGSVRTVRSSTALVQDTARAAYKSQLTNSQSKASTLAPVSERGAATATKPARRTTLGFLGQALVSAGAQKK